MKLCRNVSSAVQIKKKHLQILHAEVIKVLFDEILIARLVVIKLKTRTLDQKLLTRVEPQQQQQQQQGLVCTHKYNFALQQQQQQQQGLVCTHKYNLALPSS